MGIHDGQSLQNKQLTYKLRVRKSSFCTSSAQGSAQVAVLKASTADTILLLIIRPLAVGRSATKVCGD
jgi:hypothetical protein